MSAAAAENTTSLAVIRLSCYWRTAASFHPLDWQCVPESTRPEICTCALFLSEKSVLVFAVDVISVHPLVKSQRGKDTAEPGARGSAW